MIIAPRVWRRLRAPSLLPPLTLSSEIGRARFNRAQQPCRDAFARTRAARARCRCVCTPTTFGRGTHACPAQYGSSTMTPSAASPFPRVLAQLLMSDCDCRARGPEALSPLTLPLHTWLHFRACARSHPLPCAGPALRAFAATRSLPSCTACVHVSTTSPRRRSSSLWGAWHLPVVALHRVGDFVCQWTPLMLADCYFVFRQVSSERDCHFRMPAACAPHREIRNACAARRG